jgi:transcriptional regulator GlxA family with amidase domain
MATRRACVRHAVWPQSRQATFWCWRAMRFYFGPFGSRSLPFPKPHREVAVLRVGLFLPANFSVLSFAPVAAFETANFVARERFYDLRLVSESGKRTANSLGGTVDTEPMGEHSYDTLLVGATSEIASPTPRTITLLREAAASARRIASTSEPSR